MTKTKYNTANEMLSAKTNYQKKSRILTRDTSIICHSLRFLSAVTPFKELEGFPPALHLHIDKAPSSKREKKNENVVKTDQGDKILSKERKREKSSM